MSALGRVTLAIHLQWLDLRDRRRSTTAMRTVTQTRGQKRSTQRNITMRTIVTLREGLRRSILRNTAMKMKATRTVDPGKSRRRSATRVRAAIQTIDTEESLPKSVSKMRARAAAVKTAAMIAIRLDARQPSRNMRNIDVAVLHPQIHIRKPSHARPSTSSHPSLSTSASDGKVGMPVMPLLLTMNMRDQWPMGGIRATVAPKGLVTKGLAIQYLANTIGSMIILGRATSGTIVCL